MLTIAGVRMNRFSVPMALVAGVWLASAAATRAAPCLIVTLTGTQGGPGAFNGLAGPGTLVRYGEDANDCGAINLQFDAGRGTTMRLAQLGVTVGHLDAIFFTHMHSDHVDGFADIMQLRWQFEPTRPKCDVVCSADTVSATGVAVSCKQLALHIADAYIQSGEIAQRISEHSTTGPAGGPAELTNVITFEPKDEPQVVWSSGDVRVSGIRSAHMAGHASYRVDTPAGSVVIGGDAANDVPEPPRTSSTSDQVERLAKGVDVIVHSAIHPIMGPASGFPPVFFYRQSTVTDLGAMAKRVGAKYLMLTHLLPPLGARRIGSREIPGTPLTEADYRKAVEISGFTGNTIVGTDLASVRLPAK
jgi:ribonuclease Z